MDILQRARANRAVLSNDPQGTSDRSSRSDETDYRPYWEWTPQESMEDSDNEKGESQGARRRSVVPDLYGEPQPLGNHAE